MPDPLFRELFTDTEQLRPAPITQVQARARQRSRRQRLSVVATTLVLAVPVGVAVTLGEVHRGDGDPAVVASTGPQPTADPTPLPSSTPTSAGTPTRPPTGPSTPTVQRSAPTAEKLTSVPTTALLQADDLGGSGWTTSTDGVEGDWSLAATLGYCPARRGLEFYGDPVHRRFRGITRGRTDAGVRQEVLLFRPGGAQKYYDYYQQGAAACAEHVSELSRDEVRMTIVAQGFAGRRSILVRTTSRHGTGLHGVVVHGDLATQFAVLDRSEATGRQLGTRARDRLCQATRTC